MNTLRPGTYVEFADEWFDDGWFRFPRSLARDETLTHAARGLACQLASHARRSFRFSTEELVRHTANGESAIRSMIKELEEHGYLERTRERDTQGRLGVMIYKLNPFPQVKAQNGKSPVGLDQGKQGPDDDVRNVLPLETGVVETEVLETGVVETGGGIKKSTEGTTHFRENTQDAPLGAAAAPPPGELDLGLPAIPEPEPAQNAGAVVAAYVSTFQARTGSRPLGRDIGKIGKEAERMLTDPAIDFAALLRAAVELAGTQFTDLATQYRRMQVGPQAPSLPVNMAVDNAYWARQAAQAAAERAANPQPPRPPAF